MGFVLSLGLVCAAAADIPYGQDIDNEEEIGSEISNNLKDKNIIAEKFHMKKIGRGTEVTLNQGGFLEIEKDGKKIRYEGFNYNEDTKFVFDSKGNLVGAKFTKDGSDGRFVFENSEFLVPKNSEVVYKDGRVDIKPPENFQMELIKTESGEERTLTVVYELPPEVIKIFKSRSNGDAYKFKSSKGLKIGFDEQGYFFENEDIEIDGLILKNPEKLKVYFDFNGEDNEDYRGVYISMNKGDGKFVTGTNIDKSGPVVVFNKDNEYRFPIDADDNDNTPDDFSIRADPSDYGSYVAIRGKYKHITPLTSIFGAATTNAGGISPFVDSKSGKVLIDIKKNRLGGYDNSGRGYIPMEYRITKVSNGVITNAFKGGNVMVIGNDGRVGVGPNPSFIKVKSAPYEYYPGLYHGVSNRLLYNGPIDERDFELLTGITVQDYIGTSSKRFRTLLDVVLNSDPVARESFNYLRLTNRGGYSGLAESWYNGGRRITLVGSAGVLTLDHEIGHTAEWEAGGKFERWWDATGGYSGPLTYWYGYRGWGAEKVSTFREKIHDTWWGNRNDGTYFGSWESGLGDRYSYSPQIRARVALMERFGLINMDEAKWVFGQAGLDYNSNLAKTYIERGTGRTWSM